MHQFVHIGAHAFTGMGTFLPQDLPPYVMAAGNLAQPFGINTEGLKRRGFRAEAIAGAEARLQDALPQRPAPGGSQAASSEAQAGASRRKCATVSLDFLARSKRGIIR